MTKGFLLKFSLPLCLCVNPLSPHSKKLPSPPWFRFYSASPCHAAGIGRPAKLCV